MEETKYTSVHNTYIDDDRVTMEKKYAQNCEGKNILISSFLNVISTNGISHMK